MNDLGLRFSFFAPVVATFLVAYNAYFDRVTGQFDIYSVVHGKLQPMPVVFRYKSFRFFFYSNEGNPREAMYIHVRGADGEAKF